MRGPDIRPDDRPDCEPDVAKARFREIAISLSLMAIATLLMGVLIPLFVKSPMPARPVAMAPWMLPQIAGGIMLLASCVLLVQALRGKTVEDADQSAAAVDVSGLFRGLIAVLAFPVLLPLAGALLTCFLIVFALIATSPGQSIAKAAVISAGLSAMAWLMFSEIAGTPLPAGLLGLG